MGKFCLSWRTGLITGQTIQAQQPLSKSQLHKQAHEDRHLAPPPTILYVFLAQNSWAFVFSNSQKTLFSAISNTFFGFQ